MSPVRQMLSRIEARRSKLGPGAQSFIKNLSIVTVCFALSKIFSSLAALIVARYLGKVNFGEARIVMLMAQMLSLLMLFGLHNSVMRYGSGKDDPAPEIASTSFLSGIAILICSGGIWLFRAPLEGWLGLTDYKVIWSIVIGILLCGYAMFTSVQQTLHMYKQRGVLEVVFAALLLPGLLIGYAFTRLEYTTQLIAYSVSYGCSVLYLLWRLRSYFSFRHLFATNTGEMVKYGGMSLLSNIGFILTFTVQPMQIRWAHGDGEVGIFTVYSIGSVGMALFAASIFSTVFFPKISASDRRPEIWRLLTKAWLRVGVPLFLLFVVITTVAVTGSGSEYPLIWRDVLLFALVSTVIAIHSTYGQLLAAQGIAGVRWGLILSLFSGCINLLLTHLLVPKWGITGAVLALLANYTINLLLTLSLRSRVGQPNVG